MGKIPNPRTDAEVAWSIRPHGATSHRCYHDNQIGLLLVTDSALLFPTRLTNRSSRAAVLIAERKRMYN